MICDVVFIHCVNKGALYIKLNNREEKWYAWRMLYAYFAFGFGIVMCVICLYSTIAYNDFKPEGC